MILTIFGIVCTAVHSNWDIERTTSDRNNRISSASFLFIATPPFINIDYPKCQVVVLIKIVFIIILRWISAQACFFAIVVNPIRKEDQIWIEMEKKTPYKCVPFIKYAISLSIRILAPSIFFLSEKCSYFFVTVGCCSIWKFDTNNFMLMKASFGRLLIFIQYCLLKRHSNSEPIKYQSLKQVHHKIKSYLWRHIKYFVIIIFYRI